MHLQTVGSQAYLIQQPFGVLYPAFRPYITFQVMAVSHQSTGYHDSVGSLFESLENVQGIQLASTGQPYDLEVGGIL